VDAEGCWKIVRSHKNGINVQFYVGTTDLGILKEIKNKLTQMGFTVHLYLEKKKGTRTNLGVYRKNLYALIIYRNSEVIKLARTLLSFCRHPEKVRRMKLISHLSGKTWNQIKILLLKISL